ncbi:hypothetical protein JB92DRAFT_3025282 [Gautieria morchelliformis]|nr:hypothetical protein JB92DRAFT_3025282 [Gautieria morchelliformis]
MASNHHGQLVASMKDAENEAKNDTMTGRRVFLGPVGHCCNTRREPEYSLREVYEALLHTKAWSLLDPLNILPLLVPSMEDTALEFTQVIAREGNPKEAVIFVHEALERLERAVQCEEQSNEESVSQLMRLLVICCESIPRLQLRRRGPADTLRPLLTQIGVALETVAPLARGDEGKNIIYSVLHLIRPSVPWVSRNTHPDDPHSQAAMDLLLNLLYSTLTAYASHIRASLAQRTFEMYYPRLVLHTNVDPTSEAGKELMQNAAEMARILGGTPVTLTSPPLSIGKLILLAHGEPPSLMSSNFLQKLLPTITLSLQQNVAMDESLALLLNFMAFSSDQLPQEIVDPVATLITPLASTHSHPPTRHMVFRILQALLARAPPPIRLAHLSSLLIDCPFPQMRVAAVGLVKEAFLNAITSTGTDQSLFKSETLIRALGPTLFRPDPPDLFASPTSQSLRAFLDSSEPARLTECLAFYYILLKRDTSNSSGIRDQDMLRTVKNSLLSPLRNALTTWLEAPGIGDLHTLMPIGILETSLERVDAAVASLPLS